jgi:hypothetical protein
MEAGPVEPLTTPLIAPVGGCNKTLLLGFLGLLMNTGEA